MGAFRRLRPLALCSYGHAKTLARTRAYAGIVAVWALDDVAGLGSTSLSEPDEPRFAEATRQMFLRGDFLTPYFNGVPRFEKPILFYWMQAPAFAMLGPTETAARLPTAIVHARRPGSDLPIGERLLTRRAAIVGALILATTFRFAVWSRQGLTDVPVLFWMLAALYWWAKSVPLGTGPTRKSPAAVPAVDGRRRARGVDQRTGRGAAAGVSVAIWSPPANASDTPAAVLPGVLMAAAIVLPWYAWMAWLHGRAFLDFALGYEVVARYGISTAFPSFPRSFFWYFQIYPGDAAPWTLFIVAAIGWSLWRLRSFAADDQTRGRLPVDLVLRDRARLLDGEIQSDALHPAGLSGCLIAGRSSARSSVSPIPRRTGVALAPAVRVDDDRRRRSRNRPRGLHAPCLSDALARSRHVAAACTRWSSDRDDRFGIASAARAGSDGTGRRTVPGDGDPRRLRRPSRAAALSADTRARRTDCVAGGPDASVGLAGRLGGPGLIFYSRHDIAWLDSMEDIATSSARRDGDSA